MPKGHGLVESNEPFAELSLCVGKLLLVPFEQPSARTDDGAVARAKNWQKVLRDPHVVGVAEIVLQTLQWLHKFLQIVLVEQAPEKLRRIAQFLGGDAKFVPLWRRQSAEPFTSFAYLAPASIEQMRGQFADW